MNILIGCEESGVLSSTLRPFVNTVFSCDLKPTRGNSFYHIQDCITKVIPRCKWDLIILHPDCTALATSGNAHYSKGKHLHHLRLESIEWTKNLWELAKSNSISCALENPNSVIFRHLNAKSFSLQPWQHGHGEVKETRFALNNLSPLLPSNICPGREARILNMSPSINRKRDRSETYQGIANAILNQWVKPAAGVPNSA